MAHGMDTMLLQYIFKRSVKNPKYRDDTLASIMLYTRCFVRIQKVWISSVEIIAVLTLYTSIGNVLLH